MKLLVYSNAREGRDEEFNEWYDKVHLPDLLSIPGVTAATRYRVQTRDGEIPEHRYLTIYELEGDPEAVLQELRSRSASGEFRRSDSVDASTAKITTWKPI
ncbi:hypothetical protein ACWD4J_38315 [Streptomyces sp. NPDC002577]